MSRVSRFGALGPVELGWIVVAFDTKVVTSSTGQERTVVVSQDGTQQCLAILEKGQCERWALRGATVCNDHGGQLPNVKRKAVVLGELMDWGLTDTTEDPGEILLRLVTQSSRRVALYSYLLMQAYEHAELIGRESQMPSFPSGVQALIGGTFSATNDGHVYQTGEQIRGLVALEAQERDRCANFATKAIAAGLAERQVRIAERVGESIVAAITAALDALGIVGEARQTALNAAAERLELTAA